MILISLGLSSSCAGEAPARESETPSRRASAVPSGEAFARVEGIEWILTEIRMAGRTVRLDRQKYQAEDRGDIFTASFQEGRISGMGAPNRFFGPYTVGPDDTGGSGGEISMGSMAATLMMALWEPEEITELEFFSYLSNTTRWDLRRGRLELYGTNLDGAVVVLIFIPN
ncbi:MAG: META domain-containing protein [Treponema sp.]|nr:META domain-containing protein [Treponema sp.]